MDNGSAKILVVDDIPENVRLLEAVLVPRGYEVVAATSGERALELVAETEPDLVLLDVVMPGMDGYTVCRSLRANEETAILPVIMVTSSIGPEKTEAIEAGADDFIPKPFNHAELLTRVKSLLRIKRYQDTIKAQSAELRELNRTLEQRVLSQVEALQRQADELRASRARIVAAADAERRRIERDLHDGAQQYLVGLAANLRAAQDLIESDPVKANAILDELSGSIRQAMQEFRDLSHGIYPPLLQDRGLAEALAHAARGVSIPAHVESNGLRRYEPAVEATIYFCCVEALQNAAKHAGEDASANVRVWEQNGEILFEVSDDGSGMDPAHRALGAGLTNMQDRVGAIGGSVRVESEPGRGTTVLGAIPLEDQPSSSAR
ncbi:MAG TPA: response regulator [Gaiellaceae bacterium]